MNNKRKSFYSVVGGVLAFVLSLSCCWLPALLIGLGGATGLLSFADSVESYSGVFMTIGTLLLGYGLYRSYLSRSKPSCCEEDSTRCC